MRRRPTAAHTALMTALAALAASSAPCAAGARQDKAGDEPIRMAVGQTRVIEVPGLERVVVPPGSVVDVKEAGGQGGPARLLVVAMEVGEAQIRIVTGQGVQVRRIEVTGRPTGLGPLLAALAEPPYRDAVALQTDAALRPVLTGDLDDLEAYRRLHERAAAREVGFEVMLAPKAYAPLVERVRARLAEAGLSGVSASGSPIYPPIRITGRVRTAAAAKKAEAIASELCAGLASVTIEVAR